MVTYHVYEEGIPFTRQSWRGRSRACRAIEAALLADEVERFNQESLQGQRDTWDTAKRGIIAKRLGKGWRRLNRVVGIRAHEMTWGDG